VVSKNGIYVRAHDRLYWSDDLLERAGASGRDRRRQIVYRYRTDDDSHIYVFDAETGKYLCSAAPFTGDQLHPLAAAGSHNADQVSAAMEFKGHVAKAFRGQVRDLKKASFDVLLTAQQAGARAGGRLAATPAPMPAAPAVIQMTPQVSKAANDAANDKTRDDQRREGRAKLHEVFAMASTGTDAAPARRDPPAKRANTAMDILADTPIEY